MQRLTYFIFRFSIFLFSLMPFALLYLISDALQFLFYRVIKYRYVVIKSNLENSFPEKSPVEIQTLVKGAYKNLCDILLEGVKGLTMSEAECRKRYKFLNPEVANELYAKGKSMFILATHYGNWEWGPQAISLQIKHHTLGIVAPIKNKYIDSYIKNSRSFEKVSVVPMRETYQAFERFKDRLTAYVFIMDQSPSNAKKAHWVKFLNQDTAVLHGADNHARRMGYPLVFFEQHRVKRGHYEIRLTKLFDDASGLEVGEISALFMEKLEAIILAKPEDWLWSHRRWKKRFDADCLWVGSPSDGDGNTDLTG